MESDPLRLISSIVLRKSSALPLDSVQTSHLVNSVAGRKKPKREVYINLMDYLSTLAPKKTSLSRNRKAKIMCTIGSATRHPEDLEKMIQKGMNIARIMIGSGSYGYHKETIQFVREAADNYSKKMGRLYPVGIAVDLKGNGLRIGYLECGLFEVILKKGDKICVTSNRSFRKKCNSDHIWMNYPEVEKVVNVGGEILLNDGLIALTVLFISGEMVFCEVRLGGKMISKQSVHIPGAKFDFPAITEKDKEEILFALDQDVDFVMVSSVQSADRVMEVRKFLGEEGRNIAVIAKIESGEGVKNLNSIMYHSDGVCLARINLGIDISSENMIIVQKSLAATCVKVGKPFLVVSHFLRSMCKNPRPTQNEISDIANAVNDGTDCIILGHETSSGYFPLEAVQTVELITKEAEAVVWKSKLFRDLCFQALPPIRCDEAMAITAVEMAAKSRATAILLVTRSGRSAALLSKYQPVCPIIAVIRNEHKAKHLLLYKGIEPVIYTEVSSSNWLKDVENRLQFGMQIGLKEGLITPKEPIVILMGSKPGEGFTNSVRLTYVSETPSRILY